MTTNNASYSKVRKHHTTVSTFLVRCVCVVVFFVTTGLGLAAFALTCFLMSILDGDTPSCPGTFIVTASALAGALLALGLVLLGVACRKKKRLNKESLLEELPDRDEQYRRKPSNPDDNTAGAREAPQAPHAAESFEMTQKTADVSHWIEQQKSVPPCQRDCFPLESKDAATSNTSGQQDASDGEMTAL